MGSSAGEVAIVDLGSGFIKAGLQHENMPSCIFPSLVGRPRRRYASAFPGNPCFVGEAAVDHRDKLSFYYPIDHGHIENWEEMEELWSHLFHNGLNIEGKNHPVLCTVPPLASSVHQSKIAELLFETYDIPELCLAVQAIMSLHATGLQTGLVVEIGEGVTQVVPVYQGYATRTSLKRMDFAGQELTMYLQKLLCDNGYQLTSRDDFEHVRMIKETLCFASLNPQEDDLRQDLNVVYELPDGMTLRDGSTKSITLGPERFYCAEALMDPRLIGRDNPPLTELIWQAIKDSPIEIRRELLGSICLSGGTSLLPGLADRIKAELVATAPPSAQQSVKVVADDLRLFGVWLGAKIFSDPALRDLQHGNWTLRSEWMESGPSILVKKDMIQG